MNIKINKEGEKTTIYLSGSIDIPGAESLKNTLNQVNYSESKEVILDFKEVNFIGSSGIGKLLLFYKNYTSEGGKVHVSNLNKDMKHLFKSIKLDRLFNI